jgi:two-component system nitrogen regulation response regulator GlnG
MELIDNKIIELDDSLYKNKQGSVYKYVLEIIERPLIEHALERTFGNQLKAAKILGINRNTIRTKIKKLGIDPERWKI